MGCIEENLYLFSQSSINNYNKLSDGCVNASSVYIFKNKVDNLAMAGYT